MANTTIEFICIPGTTAVYLTTRGGTGTPATSYVAVQIAGYLHKIVVPEALEGKWYLGAGDTNGSFGFRSDLSLQDVEYTYSLEEDDKKGAGAVQHSVTIQNEGDPVDGAEVWVSTDEAGTHVIAGVLNTDSDGVVTFSLDPGTYYVWAQRAGVNFTNPTEITVP